MSLGMRLIRVDFFDLVELMMVVVVLWVKVKEMLWRIGLEVLG